VTLSAFVEQRPASPKAQLSTSFWLAVIGALAITAGPALPWVSSLGGLISASATNMVYFYDVLFGASISPALTYLPGALAVVFLLMYAPTRAKGLLVIPLLASLIAGGVAIYAIAKIGNVDPLVQVAWGAYATAGMALLLFLSSTSLLAAPAGGRDEGQVAQVGIPVGEDPVPAPKAMLLVVTGTILVLILTSYIFATSTTTVTFGGGVSPPPPADTIHHAHHATSP